MRATGSSADTALRKRLDVGGFIGGENTIRRDDQAGEIEIQHRADQNPRIQFGGVDAVCPQPDS